MQKVRQVSRRCRDDLEFFHTSVPFQLWGESSLGWTRWGDLQWVTEKGEVLQRTSDQHTVRKEGALQLCRRKMMLQLLPFPSMTVWDSGLHWGVCCNVFSSSSSS